MFHNRSWEAGPYPWGRQQLSTDLCSNLSAKPVFGTGQYCVWVHIEFGLYGFIVARRSIKGLKIDRSQHLPELCGASIICFFVLSHHHSTQHGLRNFESGACWRLVWNQFYLSCVVSINPVSQISSNLIIEIHKYS